jgi:hypothetical protein
MIKRITLITLVGVFSLNVVVSQEVVVYKTAVVVLHEDPAVRADFEESLAAKFREHNYDAVTTYDFLPDTTGVDDAGFAERLAAEGIQAILMMRPAAIGAGSTLESVRDEVSPEIYSDIEAFAGEISSSGGKDVFAVIHMAIYLITDDGAELISAGASWLEGEAESREQAIEQLQDLVVGIVDNARPLIRQHLGLAPLE